MEWFFRMTGEELPIPKKPGHRERQHPRQANHQSQAAWPARRRFLLTPDSRWL
jgi:hypothetical protein